MRVHEQAGHLLYPGRSLPLAVLILRCRIIRLECRHTDSRRGQHQSDNRLRVFDFAVSNHLQSAPDGQTYYLDHFVVFWTRCRLSEISSQIEPHLFRTEAGRDKELAELFELPGHQTQLFFQLTRRSFFWSFAIIQTTSRQLQQVLDRGMTILAHQRNRAVFESRENHLTTPMMNDFAHVSLIALAHRIDGDVEDSAGEYLRGIEKFRCFRLHVSTV